MLTTATTKAFMFDFNAICVKHGVPLMMHEDGDVTYTSYGAWKADKPNRLH